MKEKTANLFYDFIMINKEDATPWKELSDLTKECFYNTVKRKIRSGRRMKRR